MDKLMVLPSAVKKVVVRVAPLDQRMVVKTVVLKVDNLVETMVV